MSGNDIYSPKILLELQQTVPTEGHVSVKAALSSISLSKLQSLNILNLLDLWNILTCIKSLHDQIMLI